MNILQRRSTALILFFLAALGLGLPAQGAGYLLNLKREGSNVIVNFAGLLQTAGCPDGPYTTLFGATSPYLWPVSHGPRQFWRAATAGGGTFSAGDAFTVALKTDGSLASWGWNDSGQLGAPGPGDWISVVCGHSHTVALQSDGTLWAWGGNWIGQLGLGGYDFERHYQPARVGPDADWAAVQCGRSYTMALKANGTLWAWGSGAYGQLGNGTYDAAFQPIRAGMATDWVRVACGPNHTAALKSDGSLWAWGDNVYGQLGNGTNDRTNQPVRVGSDTDWQAVACGGYPPLVEPDTVGHTVALKTDGSLWAWGDNSFGQLGNGTLDHTNQPVPIGTDRDWAAVACGNAYTVALKANGTLWAWGENYSGQLGNGTNDGTNQPVRVGSDTNWIRVTCGGGHTIALKANGTLWAWGDNTCNQLGPGILGHTNLPAQIGTDTDWAH